jgi:hypothetical protein
VSWENWAHVDVAADLLSRARSEYPPAGSVDGRPRLGQFQDGPLGGAKSYFSREFDNAPAADEEGRVRYYVTTGTYFPPIVFYAAKIDGVVTIIDYDADDDYWDLIENDPDDI